MTQVQIQQDLADRLTSSRDSVELRTEQGRLVGFFVPAGVGDEDVRRRLQSAFTDEEIERARSEPGGSTLKELLDELEQRWPST